MNILTSHATSEVAKCKWYNTRDIRNLKTSEQSDITILFTYAKIRSKTICVRDGLLSALHKLGNYSFIKILLHNFMYSTRIILKLSIAWKIILYI